jgi:hypothetical protein
MPTIRTILAEEGLLKGSRTATLNSVADDVKKAQRSIDDGDNEQALHHLSNVFSELAWTIKELGDPQADMVMDASRKFTREHR